MVDAEVTAIERPSSASPADTLILVPSISYSEGLLNALPYVRYFGERNLSDLSALRNPGMRIVLVTAEDIDPWIVNRTLADFSAGDGRLHQDMHRRLECLGPRASGRAPLADAVLADPRTMARLHDIVQGARASLLVNFAASEATDELAGQLGVPAEEGPVSTADRWGTKAGSKGLFRESGVLCPRGDLDVVRSVAAATLAAQRLVVADPFLERIIIKLNASEWGDGMGNAVVNCSTLSRTDDLHRSVETLAQPWEAYCRELSAGGAVVEEYIAGATCWPSAQGRIRRDHGFELLATHEQILVEGEYLGCRFPVEPDLALMVSDAMTKVGVALERHGVYGSLGVDFIVAGGRIYATEINLRKVGSSHVIKAVHALIGGGACAASDSIVGMPAAYVNRRLYQPELFSTLTPKSALAALHRQRLGYDRSTRSGTLLHIMGALGPVGYVETTSIATTSAHARDLDEQAVAALTATACELRTTTASL